jgi:hypothetical protein
MTNYYAVLVCSNIGVVTINSVCNVDNCRRFSVVLCDGTAVTMALVLIQGEPEHEFMKNSRVTTWRIISLIEAALVSLLQRRT